MMAKSWKDKPMYLTQVGTWGPFELELDCFVDISQS